MRPILVLWLAGVACSHRAPPDMPVSGATAADDAALQNALRACTVKARASYPDVKRRFIAGLPAGQTLAITVELVEGSAKEQLFVTVERISGEEITGRISNTPVALRSHKYGDVVVLREAELLDWTVVRRDGSEEGNLRGKFVDAIQAGRTPQC